VSNLQKLSLSGYNLTTHTFICFLFSNLLGEFLGHHHRDGKKILAVGLVAVSAAVLAVGLYKHLKHH